MTYDVEERLAAELKQADAYGEELLQRIDELEAALSLCNAGFKGLYAENEDYRKDLEDTEARERKLRACATRFRDSFLFAEDGPDGEYAEVPDEKAFNALCTALAKTETP